VAAMPSFPSEHSKAIVVVRTHFVVALRPRTMWARQLAAALRHAASTRTQHTQCVHASSMATHS
jgi:hypothetical protein